MSTTIEQLAERLNDQDLSIRERARAVRAVASASANAADCRALLDALGLDPDEGRETPPRPRPASR